MNRAERVLTEIPVTNPVHFVPDPKCVSMHDFIDLDDPCGVYFAAFEEFMYGPQPYPDTGWYFWNEIWVDRIGPYCDKRRCEDALKRYCKEVLGD